MKSYSHLKTKVKRNPRRFRAFWGFGDIKPLLTGTYRTWYDG